MGASARAAAVFQSGAFAEGDTIAFRGIEVRIDGAPAAGDRFDVDPSMYQDVFATLDRVEILHFTDLIGTEASDRHHFLVVLGPLLMIGAHRR